MGHAASEEVQAESIVTRCLAIRVELGTLPLQRKQGDFVRCRPAPVKAVAGKTPKQKRVSAHRRKDWDLTIGARSRKQRGFARKMWDRDQISSVLCAVFGGASSDSNGR